MLVITTDWYQRTESFKLIPTSLDCPYVEALFDPDHKILVVLSREKEYKFTMLTKLDDKGKAVQYKQGSDVVPAKERRQIDSFFEYFIYKKEEILNFVEMFSIDVKNDNGEPLVNFKQIVEDAFAAQEMPANLEQTV
jgi:alpha-mannosidase